MKEKTLEKLKNLDFFSSKNKWLIGYSFLFSLVYVLGSYLYQNNTLVGVFSKGRWREEFLVILLMTFVMTWILKAFLFLGKWLSDWTACGESGPRGTISGFFRGFQRFLSWMKGLAAWILLFASWLPCYLAYFPGVFSYDANSQREMLEGLAPFTTHHPPVHTWIMGFCFWIADLVGREWVELLAYSLIQMLLLSFLLSRLLCTLSKRVPGIFSLLSLAFWMLNPAIALFSFSQSKDSAFAICLVGLFLVLLPWLEGKDEESISKTTAWILACCLFRNNFVHAWIPACVILLWKGLARNPKRKMKFLKANAFALLAFFIVTKGIYPALGITEAKTAETLSIPAQQIGAIVCNEELTQEELDAIAVYVDPEHIREFYNPRLADYVKNYISKEAYDADKADFWKLWWQLVKQYPQDAFDAALTLNIPYWYQGANPVDPYSNREYVETDIDNLAVERANIFPRLYQWYQGFAEMKLYNWHPEVRFLFCLATPIWLMLGCAALLLTRKQYHYAAGLIPFLLYWATFLFGPVSNARYLFPFMIFYPVFMALPFVGKSEREDEDGVRNLEAIGKQDESANRQMDEGAAKEEKEGDVECMII